MQKFIPGVSQYNKVVWRPCPSNINASVAINENVPPTADTTKLASLSREINSQYKPLHNCLLPYRGYFCQSDLTPCFVQVDDAELACLCGDVILWRNTAVSCKRGPRAFPLIPVLIAAAPVIVKTAKIASAVIITGSALKNLVKSGHSGLESGHSGLGGQPEGHLEVCHDVLTYASGLHSLVGLCEGVQSSHSGSFQMIF